MRYLHLIVLLSFSLTAVDVYSSENTKKTALFYLNNLSSFKADFTQTNSDQSKQQGSLLISKPGSIKWDYESPTSITILIKDNWLTYYDKAINEYTYSFIDDSIYTLLSCNDINSLDNIEFIHTKLIKNKQYITIKDIKTQMLAEIIFNIDPMFLSELNISPNSDETTSIKFHNINYNQYIDKKEFVINNDSEYNALGEIS